MAVDLSATHSGKENLLRHTGTQVSGGGKNRTPLGPGANVLKPRFPNFPDPLRCHPVDGEQFHELVERDAAHSAWPTRADVECSNARLFSGGAASSSSSGLPDAEPPVQPIDPMPPQPSAAGTTLSPVQLERVATNDVPSILVTDVDRVGMDGAEHGDDEQVAAGASSGAAEDSDSNSRPVTRDSDTSPTRGAVFRAPTVWNARNSLSKSHSMMGIHVAGKGKWENDVPQETKGSRRAQTPLDFTLTSTGASRVRANRPDHDIPSTKVPSCVGLPPGWDTVHDRCIAYLSTHAPLTASGKIPSNEIAVERYTTDQISDFLVTRFPIFHRYKKIPHWAIEKRLQMLDIKENEYFRVPYGGYRFEAWGVGI